MITRLSSVSVTVTDQDKALDFYVNKLGFEKRQDAPMSADERWIEVAPIGAETTIQLGKNHGHTGERMGTFVGFVFHTTNLEATVGGLKQRGVRISVEPKHEPWGHWAQFVDQDNNEFGLIQTPD